MNKDYPMGKVRFFFALVLNVLISASAAFAQTSEFTFQGKFPEAGGTASGNYQMEFRLFDAATAGNQIGSTILNASVPVTKSVFTVNLDFGFAAFSGADRYLEIATRKSFVEPFTLLGPRQKITSSPYSIKSKNADAATTAGFAVAADTANVATRAFDSLKLGGLEPSRFVRYDNNNNVGIGTDSTGSKLAVGGTVESKAGGFKFPDSTTQTTAGITSVDTNGTLTGNGTPASPLGVSSPLMVRDLDHPTRQPFAVTGQHLDDLLNVPAGKVAVIEFATVRMWRTGTTLDSAEVILRIYGFDDSLGQFFYLAPSSTRLLSSQPTQVLAHYTYSVRLYVKEFGRLQLRCTNEAGITGCVGTVSGYYVDVP